MYNTDVSVFYFLRCIALSYSQRNFRKLLPPIEYKMIIVIVICIR